MTQYIYSELEELLGYTERDLNIVIHRQNYKMFSTNKEPQRMIRVYERNYLDLAKQKFDTEAYMLKKMDKYKEIPTPKFVQLEYTERATSILIMEKLTGIPLHEAWNYFSHENRCNIAEDFGQMLDMLHQIDQSGYGMPHNFFEDWSDFITHRIRKNVVILEPQLGKKLTNKINQHLADWTDAISSSSPVIVHGDLNPHNILISEIEERPIISGIIDWEWSIAGNCLYDLVETESLFYNSPRILEAFYKGYGSLPNRYNWNLERKVYLLDRFLQTASYDLLTDTYSKQQQQLTRFLLQSILR